MSAAKKITSKKASTKKASVKKTGLAKLSAILGTHKQLLVALLIVVGVSIVGYYGYVRSNANTTYDATYSIPVASELGCKLAGRVYDSAAKSCKAECRSKSKDVVFKRTTGTPPRGYCTGYAATNTTPAECIGKLHRYFLEGVGCSRRPAQENTNTAPQCIPGFPNYVAETQSDRCIVQTIANTNNPGSGGNNPTIPNTPTPPAITTAIDCILLGRAWDGPKNTCKQECVKDAGTLIVGTKSNTNYCRYAVSPEISHEQCITTMHRVWTSEGCARRHDQQDVKGALQCQSDFPYYNANYYNAKTKTKTLTDFCERSKEVAIANQIAGTPGNPDTTPSTDDGDGSGGSNGGNNGGGGDGSGGGNNGGNNNGGGNSGELADTRISEESCKLLGRKFIPQIVKDGETFAAGCSVEECNDTKDKMVWVNGRAKYCTDYAQKITSDQCAKFHRVWVSEVQVCSQHPKQERTRPLVDAAQCISPYTTYIFHAAGQGSDECLKPSTVQWLEGLAKKVGKPVGFLASLSKKGLCNIRNNTVWNGEKCIKNTPTDPVQQPQEDPGNITVISANIYTSLNPAQFRQDLTRVMAKNPDVIALQEAHKRSDKEIAINGYNAWRANGSDHEEETPVLWRTDTWKAVDKGTKRLSTSDVRWGTRTANWVTLENKGNKNEVFTVISIHLITDPAGSPANVALMSQSMDNLNALIADRAKYGPVIPAGDFNYDYATDSTDKRANFPKIALKKTKAVSTYELLGKPTGGWITAQGGPGYDKASTLDYLFLTQGKGLKAVRHSVYTNLHSDHNAVVGVFSFGNGGGGNNGGGNGGNNGGNNGGGNNGTHETQRVRFSQTNLKNSLSPAQFHADLSKVMSFDPDFVSVNETNKRTDKQLEINGYRSWRDRVAVSPSTPILWKDSRWTVLDKGMRWLSHNQKGVYRSDRYANWVTLRSKTNKSLVVTAVSVHMITRSGKDSVSAGILREEMGNLTDLVKSRSRLGPVMVGGDFNYSYNWDVSNKLPGFPLMAFRNIGVQSTYSALGKPPAGFGTMGGPNSVTFDYIFFTKDRGLTPISHNIIRNLHSDHDAVTAVFNLSN